VLLAHGPAADTFGHEQNLADAGEDSPQRLRRGFFDAFGCLRDSHG
jgi:hypothetical protein